MNEYILIKSIIMLIVNAVPYFIFGLGLIKMYNLESKDIPKGIFVGFLLYLALQLPVRLNIQL